MGLHEGWFADQKKNKETKGSVRCVCLIAPVFAFPPLLFPVDACHHGLTELFYRSPMALPIPTSAPVLLSLCLFISPWAILRCMYVSVCLCVGVCLCKCACGCVCARVSMCESIGMFMQVK